jgi:hypothetical protein
LAIYALFVQLTKMYRSSPSSVYIRQSAGGNLMFKVYVTQCDAKPLGHLNALLSGKPGEIFGDDAFYDLDATAHDGTRWTAAGIRPAPRWDVSDLSVLINGPMQSMTARLAMPQRQHVLRLHFFEEYEVPLHRMSETERHGNRRMVRDLAEFEACGSKFEVRKREGSGDTVIEAVSENPFPEAFDLRTQEALQYITGKTVIWRARLASEGEELQFELASPLRKSARTQFSPPISLASVEFHHHGWRLFGQYLAYTIASNKGMYWNPVAYHLYNACEATAGSLDAWAVGVSVAVEAVASLITTEGDPAADTRIALLQDRMRTWFAGESDLQDFASRVNGQINAMGQKRARDTLQALTATGHVEEDYINAWVRLRNRHVHPAPGELKKPDQIDYQKLFDELHRAEVLLRQLTFYLIGYEGPFTDYGARGFPTKPYPLKLA